MAGITSGRDGMAGITSGRDGMAETERGCRERKRFCPS